MKFLAKVVYPAALATLFLSSCGRMSKVSVQMLEPGGITLPANVKTIALVDRSLSPNPMKHMTGAITGESLIQERHGAQQTLSGLSSTLSSSPRLQAKLSNALLMGAQADGVFPEPLDTATVNRICREYEADAVVALEDYNTQCITTTSEKHVNATVNGVATPTTQYYATQTATIKLGFRIYDRVNNTIGDQYSFSSSNSWTTNPCTTAPMAKTNIVSSPSALNQASYNAGVTYGRRIAPTFTAVQRKYFKKGNEEMEEAGRKASTGDWKGAADLWQKIAAEKDVELAGQATFNLAVASEMNGNLSQAEQLCDKAYSTYNIKNAKKYSIVLNQRLLEAQKLQQHVGQ